MKKLFATVIGAAILSTALSSVVATPAFALGGCGPNRHRNPWGYCVYGGQNQAWCLRHKGHYSTPTGGGVRVCF